MKKLATLTFALTAFSGVKAQQLTDKNTFISNLHQTVSVNDTLKIGMPASGQGLFLFVANKADKKIKKTGKLANGVSGVSGLFGLGGLKSAVTGIKVAQAADGVGSAAGIADVVNENGLVKADQKVVVTKFFTNDDKEIMAEAINSKKTKFLINLDKALLSKEVVSKDTNLFSSTVQEEKEN